MSRIKLLLVVLGFLAVCIYVFGALELTADHIFGFGIQYGTTALYYFPVIGPHMIWDSWTGTFTALTIDFFLALPLAFVSGWLFRELLYKHSLIQPIKGPLPFPPEIRNPVSTPHPSPLAKPSADDDVIRLD